MLKLLLPKFERVGDAPLEDSSSESDHGVPVTQEELAAFEREEAQLAARARARPKMTHVAAVPFHPEVEEVVQVVQGMRAKVGMVDQARDARSRQPRPDALQERQRAEQCICSFCGLSVRPQTPESSSSDSSDGASDASGDLIIAVDERTAKSLASSASLEVLPVYEPPLLSPRPLSARVAFRRRATPEQSPRAAQEVAATRTSVDRDSGGTASPSRPRRKHSKHKRKQLAGDVLNHLPMHTLPLSTKLENRHHEIQRNLSKFRKAFRHRPKYLERQRTVHVHEYTLAQVAFRVTLRSLITLYEYRHAQHTDDAVVRVVVWDIPPFVRLLYPDLTPKRYRSADMQREFGSRIVEVCEKCAMDLSELQRNRGELFAWEDQSSDSDSEDSEDSASAAAASPETRSPHAGPSVFERLANAVLKCHEPPAQSASPAAAVPPLALGGSAAKRRNLQVQALLDVYKRHRAQQGVVDKVPDASRSLHHKQLQLRQRRLKERAERRQKRLERKSRVQQAREAEVEEHRELPPIRSQARSDRRNASRNRGHRPVQLPLIMKGRQPPGGARNGAGWRGATQTQTRKVRAGVRRPRSQALPERERVEQTMPRRSQTSHQRERRADAKTSGSSSGAANRKAKKKQRSHLSDARAYTAQLKVLDVMEHRPKRSPTRKVRDLKPLGRKAANGTTGSSPTDNTKQHSVNSHDASKGGSDTKQQRRRVVAMRAGGSDKRSSGAPRSTDPVKLAAISHMYSHGLDKRSKKHASRGKPDRGARRGKNGTRQNKRMRRTVSIMGQLRIVRKDQLVHDRGKK